ncbi:MAG TPA: MFS transporter, partial [Burkholderiaceae bacterium]|nr:MFS transporter [Burkholderiaceae bacterium]
ASQTLHVHHVAYLVDHGLPAMTAATIVGIVGASSIVGKIGGGWLSDRIDREFIYVAGIGCVVLGIGLLGLVRWLPSLWVPYGYAVLFGAGYSVTASLAPAMVSDRFGGRNFGAIVGLSMVGGAIGSALGAWLAGFLFDLSGSYAIPFTIAGACAAAAGAAAWHARTLRRRALRAASPPT